MDYKIVIDPPKLINTRLLREQLVILNFEGFGGISWQANEVEKFTLVNFNGDDAVTEFTPEQLAEVEAVIAAHDARELSQAEILAAKIDTEIPQQIKAWLTDNPTVVSLLKANVDDREGIIMSWDLTTEADRTKLLKANVAMSNLIQFLLYREGFLD